LQYQQPEVPMKSKWYVAPDGRIYHENFPHQPVVGAWEDSEGCGFCIRRVPTKG
jgi:hypothetical protein